MVVLWLYKVFPVYLSSTARCIDLPNLVTYLGNFTTLDFILGNYWTDLIYLWMVGRQAFLRVGTFLYAQDGT